MIGELNLRVFIGWRDTVELEEGIKSMYEYYLKVSI